MGSFSHFPNLNGPIIIIRLLPCSLQWNLVNTNTVKAKYLLNMNHFEIPRHYNTNTTSYCYSEIPFNMNIF